MNESPQTVYEFGGREAQPGADAPLPKHIGRYRVERLLGKGGFGVVYLAHDVRLQRLVAIKVPHTDFVARPADADAYLTEARVVADLDHPNIVPVHDVGGSEQFPCFIVSKYIDGSNLFVWLKQRRPTIQKAVELAATVAEALHHAHTRGLVHRDIKPGNILLDKHGKPFVGDFGLALREQDLGKGPRRAGTPDYMSPEQARGEGHRVDGRSDVFSLGVVLYEMLTGRRPFRGESDAELLEQITSLEPRPPRQIDDSIPRELERICLKALSKRASERYTTAKDMSDDLRHWGSEKSADDLHPTRDMPFGAVAAPADSAAFRSTTRGAPVSATAPLRIVPKGLRSFDAHDADFFLDLLPGPRDRDGLPDSIRFWKSAIEEFDGDKTFAVGLIYGPSGCGKSSLVKAGLLPRLASSIVTVYVEATADATIARLQRGLRKRCPGLPSSLGLKDTLAAIRRGQGVGAGKKVLIVLDQFEQWLHAKKEVDDNDLVQALRQCDGERVQCIIMVRDDFWLAVSRFLRDLEIRLIEGHNSALVDLFDLDHAKRVMAAFGRAFGKLPENANELTAEQKEFLRQAVVGSAEEGKVISVRLALFAEMIKGKPWTPGTLKEMGGAEGVGVAFLEETFSASAAPPEHRYHQKAAREVLKLLLPEAGTDIKGQMRSQHELLQASGYADRHNDFEDLIRILDSEIRLITPAEPPDNDRADPVPVQAGAKYYQLTHDYLVPPLRDWLTRKQKETRRGRAELLLADRTSVWGSRQENRQLPSLLQWLQIRWLTPRKNWTAAQRKMMAKARKHYALKGLAVAIVLLVIGRGVYEALGRLKAQALRDRLVDASTNEVPTIVKDMSGYRRWLDRLLHDAYTDAQASKNSRKQLHASLALLPVDASQVEYLLPRLLEAEPDEVSVIREALLPHQDALRSRLWGVMESPEKGMQIQRLRAASALAVYDAPDASDGAEGTARWGRVSHLIADDLLASVQKNPSHFATLVDQLRPIRSSLVPPLIEVYRNELRTDNERSFATNILADYAADNPQLLADLLMDADAERFGLLYPANDEHAVAVRNAFRDELGKSRDLPFSAAENGRLAKRQAAAAIALWRLDGPASVLPLLKHSDNPTVRSYLVRRLGPFGAADALEIMRLASSERDVTIQRALVLSIAELRDMPLSDRTALMDWLSTIYEREPDAGLHAAAAYTMRALGEQARLEACLAQLRLSEAQIGERHRNDPVGSPRWHINSQGQTMIVFRGPVQFVMGSPAREVGRGDNENQHTVRIDRTFAIADQPVTVGEFRRLRIDHPSSAAGDRPDQHPVIMVSWDDAAAFCNWLSRETDISPDQWCYEINQEQGGMKPRPKCLSLTGYRLPTEAEMEFATRAGTTTSRYFGESDELLTGYGWYVPNSNGSVQGVAHLRPNDFGLFDMLGNVWNWCQDKEADPSQTVRDAVREDDGSDLVPGGRRGLRGGCYTDHAPGLRSAHRWAGEPSRTSNIIGFRVARTIIE